jgi:hypothetical protein
MDQGVDKCALFLGCLVDKPKVNLTLAKAPEVVKVLFHLITRDDFQSLAAACLQKAVQTFQETNAMGFKAMASRGSWWLSQGRRQAYSRGCSTDSSPLIHDARCNTIHFAECRKLIPFPLVDILGRESEDAFYAAVKQRVLQRLDAIPTAELGKLDVDLDVLDEWSGPYTAKAVAVHVYTQAESEFAELMGSPCVGASPAGEQSRKRKRSDARRRILGPKDKEWWADADYLDGRLGGRVLMEWNMIDNDFRLPFIKACIVESLNLLEKKYALPSEIVAHIFSFL